MLGGMNTHGTPAITTRCSGPQSGIHPFLCSSVRNGPFNLRRAPGGEGAGPTLPVDVAEGWQGSPLPAPSPARTGFGVARAVSQAGVPAPAGGRSGPLLRSSCRCGARGELGQPRTPASPAPRCPQHPSLHLRRLEGAPRAAARLRPASWPARW